jgi:hypothetical protein
MFRLWIFDPTRAKDDGMFSEVAHDGPEEAAFQALQDTINDSKAQFGQVLAEDGLILKNCVRTVN